MSALVEKMCALKYGKRGGESQALHYQEYMSTLASHMEAHGADMQALEALLYAFGSLQEKYEYN